VHSSTHSARIAWHCCSVVAFEWPVSWQSLAFALKASYSWQLWAISMQTEVAPVAVVADSAGADPLEQAEAARPTAAEWEVYDDRGPDASVEAHLEGRLACAANDHVLTQPQQAKVDVGGAAQLPHRGLRVT
jgi:hypothetical protein